MAALDIVPRQIVEQPVGFGVAELIPDPQRADGWTVAVDGVLQSYVDLADPTFVRMPFANWITQVVDRHWPPGSPVVAVHVGGAGCTIPRYVAAARPGSAQTVFELDGPLVDLVRAHLALDTVPGLRVLVQDGRAGIEGLPADTADLVVLEAFRAGEFATELATVEFFRELARVLRPGGLFTVNVWDDADLGFFLRVLASVGEVFPHVLALAEAGVFLKRRAGNVVTAASTRELPVTGLAAWAKEHGTFCLTGAQLAEVCGTAPPLTGSNPLDTPVPAVYRWGRGSRFRA
jgi:SAM-dependent methyltransferase